MESLSALLGHVNFSAGKPDPRFHRQFNEAFGHYSRSNPEQPWIALLDDLKANLHDLHTAGGAAFRDITQAEAVLNLGLHDLPAAYRKHHADLLAHVSDAELFAPFFLVRSCEAVLAQGGPWQEADRIVRGALKQLHDFLGHRPCAVLEDRRGQPYDHERIRPIPLYLRGAGVAWGRWQPLIQQALTILEQTEPSLLEHCHFDLGRLEEMALDPRGYDFGHPVDKRPNYIFGEWDPHRIDNKGYYSRFVLRQITLEGFRQRVEDHGPFPREELLFEAGVVLAGTILMAAAVSGWGPQAHDSTITLSNLVPRIAQNREQFYAVWLKRIEGDHGQRLRDEAKVTRQPFGGARQHINHFLAQHKAWQLQRRRLALLFADMGYPAAARRQIADLNVPSIRLVTEMHILLTTGQLVAAREQLDEAARNLTSAEDLLHRAIHCGAVVDPWNILGFQGQFPRWQALEDSVRDPRVEHLVHLIDELFQLHARILAEGAAAGSKVGQSLVKKMRRLAEWWDRFATTTVNDVPHVHGAEAAESAEHVAQALARWRDRSPASDQAFWREHLEGFRSPKAFSLVIEALLTKHEFRAAMGLLMAWISQAEQLPLEDGEHSFHALALGWMLGVWAQAEESQDGEGGVNLAMKFIDFLEANAESHWQAPRLDLAGTAQVERSAPDDDEESLFNAAYENVTFKDSADDDQEGALMEAGPARDDFDLADEAQRLGGRLQFLGTLARLWNIASRMARQLGDPAPWRDRIAGWLQQGRANYQGLLELMDAVSDYQVPQPVGGGYDAMVEYDRRRFVHERLQSQVIAACLDQALAIGALRGMVGDDQPSHKAPPWEAVVIRLEKALLEGRPEEAAILLPTFREQFRAEPLLYQPLAHAGSPRFILRATIAQTILRGLVANLPRLGLIQDTYRLIRLARAMEQAQTLIGPHVTEFDRLFQLAVQAVTEAAIDAAEDGGSAPAQLVDALQHLAEPFVAVWMDHNQTLRVSVLESISGEADWQRLREFIQRYGRELFHPRFLDLANLRAILHRGVGAYLGDLSADPDPMQPMRLMDELGRNIPRPDAERLLTLILQTLVENHEHYRDYKATAAQSDFGENLHQLFEFLRLKARYERRAWKLRPLAMVHEILAKRHGPTAHLWREQVEAFSRQAADEHLQELSRLEQETGLKLVTIRDRLEERFVQPLAQDRLVALIEPALEEADEHMGQDEPGELEKEIASFAAKPSGVGMDVPSWLARLETELRRLRSAKTALASLAESLFQVPKLTVPLDDLLEQMKDWKQIALEEN